MHPSTYTDCFDDSNECDLLLPHHPGSHSIISAHNLHSAKRRKDNIAVFVILCTSWLIEYAFYAINGNMVDFLKGDDLRFSSSVAVCISLTFLGSCSILTIFGGVLGEAVLNFYRVICCGLVLQLAGASFYMALGYTPNPRKDGRPLFFTCLGFQAACLTFTQAGVAILGAEQIKQRGSDAIHRFFQIMYWMNNIGSFIAILVTGTLFDQDNSNDDDEKSLKILSFIEFGFTIVCIPVFVCGKLVYSIPKKNDKALFAVFFTRSVPLIRHLWHLSLVFTLIMIAQLLHSQIDSSYAAQGRHLNLTLDTIVFPAKLSSLANNVAILLILPLFWMYKHLTVKRRTRNWYIKPIDRMAIGLLISILGVLCAGILDYFRFQCFLSGDQAPSILWQIPQYFLQGIAELFTFVTAYYFAFTEAPNGLSGLVMGLFFGARGLGSYLAAFLTYILSGSLYPIHFNESHCGYFMFLLCGISGIYIIIYLLVSNRYIPAQHKDFGEFDVFYLKNSVSDYVTSIESDVQGENTYKQISDEIEDFYSSIE